MTEKFTPYDSAEYLKTEEDIADYFDEGNPSFVTVMKIVKALGLRLHAGTV
jgi:DNA-binding phage protein